MRHPKVLERVDSPEQVFSRSFSLGAPETRPQLLHKAAGEEVCRSF